MTAEEKRRQLLQQQRQQAARQVVQRPDKRTQGAANPAVTINPAITKLPGNPNQPAVISTLPGTGTTPQMSTLPNVLAPQGNITQRNSVTQAPTAQASAPTRETVQPPVQTPVQTAGVSSDRPSYAASPQYMDYINSLLGSAVNYPDYESPYAGRIEAALQGILDYGDYESPYGDRIETALDGILNRDPFSYDYNADPAWQAYKKEYAREGRRSSEDVLGQYAAMTGGMPSTAAMTAAQQAGDYYAAQMTDKIPELYQLAYQMYADEGNRALQNLSALRGLDSDAYGRYVDRFGRLGTGLAALQGQDAIEYGRYGDGYNRIMNNLSAVKDLESDDYSRFRDTVGDWENDRAYRDNRSDIEYERDRDERRYQDERDWNERSYQDSRNDIQYQRDEAARQEADAKALSGAETAADMGDFSQLEAYYNLPSGTLQRLYSGTLYAYGDGKPYEINTWKGKAFIAGAKPGEKMTGGDGSVWEKKDNGDITITSTGGSTWTVKADEVEEAPTGSVYDQLAAAGITDEAGAYAALLGMGYSSTEAKTLAQYFIGGRGAGSGGSGRSSGTGGSSGMINADGGTGSGKWADVETWVDLYGAKAAEDYIKEHYKGLGYSTQSAALSGWRNHLLEVGGAEESADPSVDSVRESGRKDNHDVMHGIRDDLGLDSVAGTGWGVNDNPPSAGSRNAGIGPVAQRIYNTIASFSFGATPADAQAYAADAIAQALENNEISEPEADYLLQLFGY